MSSTDRADVYWEGPGQREQAHFYIDTTYVFNQGQRQVVAAWLGDEMDPMFMTPADARKAAGEWPDILRRLADEADRRQEAHREGKL